MDHRIRLVSLLGLGGVVMVSVAWGVAWRGLEPPREEVRRPPSSYARAADLESQVVYFLDRMREDLQDPMDYVARSRRLIRDANTVAVLALVLGNHDEEHRYRRAAPGMLRAALELAETRQDHGAARRAYEALLRAIESDAEHVEMPWTRVGDCAVLMAQIPALNNVLRSLVRNESRFQSSRDLASGLAASLAAIAHVSMFDGTYCPGGANQEEWIELCILMRDAARDVHIAVRQGDQQAAQAMMRPLLRTCDDCHAVFQD